MDILEICKEKIMSKTEEVSDLGEMGKFLYKRYIENYLDLIHSGFEFDAESIKTYTREQEGMLGVGQTLYAVMQKHLELMGINDPYAAVRIELKAHDAADEIFSEYQKNLKKVNEAFTKTTLREEFNRIDESLQ